MAVLNTVSEVYLLLQGGREGGSVTLACLIRVIPTRLLALWALVQLVNYTSWDMLHDDTGRFWNMQFSRHHYERRKLYLITLTIPGQIPDEAAMYACDDNIVEQKSVIHEIHESISHRNAWKHIHFILSISMIGILLWAIIKWPIWSAVMQLPCHWEGLWIHLEQCQLQNGEGEGFVLEDAFLLALAWSSIL